MLPFSRDFLSGEGDFIKHLAYLGYEVEHKQTALDEFDFAVTNIATDLKCGVRYEYMKIQGVSLRRIEKGI